MLAHADIGSYPEPKKSPILRSGFEGIPETGVSRGSKETTGSPQFGTIV
jgi:hypothetical protein